MDDLARKLRKILEYATITKRGYILSNFRIVNTYTDGMTSFRLHFRRDKAILDFEPPSFDVAIQYEDGFVVQNKGNGRDTEPLHFLDSQSVIEYLKAR